MGWGQLGGTRTDVMIKLVLVVFLSFFSFSVGTFVGKKYSDGQHLSANSDSHNSKSAHSDNHEDSHDKTSGSERGVASIPPGSTDIRPEDALSDEDIRELSEEFASADEEEGGEHVADKGHDTPTTKEHPVAEVKEHSKETHHASNDKPHVSEKSAHHEDETTKPKPEVVHEAAERVAHGKEPLTEVKKVKEERSPSSLPSIVASSTVGKYTIQVSSFKTEDEAKKAAENLKGKGYSAFYLTANVKGSPWYRVNVGLFTTRGEATTFRTKVLEEGTITAAFVQKIVE